MIMIFLGLIFLVINGAITIAAIYTGNKVLVYEKNRDDAIVEDRWNKAWGDYCRFNKKAYDVELKSPYNCQVYDEYCDVVVKEWNCDWHRIDFIAAYKSYISYVEEWIFAQYGFTKDTMQNETGKKEYYKWVKIIDNTRYYNNHSSDIDHVMNGLNKRWINAFKQSVVDNAKLNRKMYEDLLDTRRSEQKSSFMSLAISVVSFVVGTLFACNDYYFMAAIIYIIGVVIYMIKYFKNDIKYIKERICS